MGYGFQPTFLLLLTRMYLLYPKITFAFNVIILLIFGLCYLANLLNDDIFRAYHVLHRNVYAEAMAETIKVVELPSTIGIFGRWGSGKSSFLEMIKESVKNLPSSSKESVVNDSETASKKIIRPSCIRAVSAAVFLLIYIICLIWTIKLSIFIPHSIAPLIHSLNHTTVTSDVEIIEQRFHVSYYIAFLILLVFGLVVCVVMLVNQCCFGEYLHLLFVTAFAKLPRPNQTNLTKLKQQFVFVDFNAWEYSGSDRLWAAIVTKLSRKVEAQFGKVTSRLFRLFKVDNSSSCEDCDGRWFRHCIKHPKKVCHLPTLFWFVACVISFISLPFIINAAIVLMSPDIKKIENALVLKITLPLSVIYAITIAIIKCVWPLFYSQKGRIHSALARAKSNMSKELGFMNKVKTEVANMINLLNCAAFCNNRQYRVIISIDDLDRCPMEKIKSVFEAVSILLSDPSAPFVCLVAVDSRIAVKCIEETMANSLLKSNITGREYLKKIIKLPFSLPPIDDTSKKTYIKSLSNFDKAHLTEHLTETKKFESFFTPWQKESK